ncbi:MAG: hypothetical protein ACPIOQ_60480, partial [Promethearchaeia archaeon]
GTGQRDCVEPISASSNHPRPCEILMVLTGSRSEPPHKAVMGTMPWHKPGHKHQCHVISMRASVSRVL